MSTIASPRDPSAPFPRRTNSSIITPTSSSRPSLDAPASASSSPNPSSSSTSTNKRANRAALRDSSSNKDSELDSPNLNPSTYITHLLATAPLADLLRAHARILSEMRALDAEKKALVYDNYSKLIAATDTIRRMRAQHPDVLAGGGGVLEGVVEGIWDKAVGLRGELREAIVSSSSSSGSPRAVGGGGGGDNDKRGRTRELAREVVQVPGRVRRLVAEGRVEEARREWEVPRRLLVRWKELGVGGEEVGELIEEGDAALRGDENIATA